MNIKEILSKEEYLKFLMIKKNINKSDKEIIKQILIDILLQGEV